MLTIRLLALHLSRARYGTETIQDVTNPVVHVGLSLEPLTPEIARALGHNIHDHCFTSKGKIREELTNFVIRMRLPRQMLTVQMAEDSTTPTAILRQVLIRQVSIAKRGEAKEAAVEKKSRKVAPQAQVLRLTISGVLSVAEREHRDFLAARYGDSMFYTFEDEAQTLPLEPGDLSGDDDEDERSLLPPAPPPDADAGDVLEEQAAAAPAEPAPEAKSKPRLVRDRKTPSKDVH